MVMSEIGATEDVLPDRALLIFLEVLRREVASRTSVDRQRSLAFSTSRFRFRS
ncbi:MAG: hypothetical protein ACI9TF_000201 [Paracrocinitomix sp.]|jgi:hypothetical protein